MNSSSASKSKTHPHDDSSPLQRFQAFVTYLIRSPKQQFKRAVHAVRAAGLMALGVQQPKGARVEQVRRPYYSLIEHDLGAEETWN